MTQPQNLFIPADAGEKVTLPGIAITIKVTAVSTGNACAVFEEVTRPGAGPALHVHHHQFEICRFLEGTYEVKVGDAFFTAEPGAVAVVSPGHAHAFRNIGAREARLQYIIMPGASSDEFFRQLSHLLSHGEPDMAALDRLGEQFDTLFVGPPLGHGA
jgi:mannose-6-phosphate isomerase-like protein (cupin superfamily)